MSVRIPIYALTLAILCGSPTSAQVSAGSVAQLIQQLSAADPDARNQAALRLAALESAEAVSALIDWIGDDQDHPPTMWFEVLEALVEHHGDDLAVRDFVERLAESGDHAPFREAGLLFMMQKGIRSRSVVSSVFAGFGVDAQYIDWAAAIRAIPALSGRTFLTEAQQALETEDHCPGAVVLLREFSSDSARTGDVVFTTRAALRNGGRTICSDAVALLGSFGHRARSSITELTAFLAQAPSDSSEENLPRSLAAAAALANIGLDLYEHAEDFSRSELTGQIAALQGAQAQFRTAFALFDAWSSDSFENMSLAQRSLRIAIKGLSDNRARRIVEPVRAGIANTLRAYPLVSALLAYIVFMLLLRTALLRAWPLGLLRLNEFLHRVTDQATGKDLGVWAAPIAGVLGLIRWLSVIGLLKHPPRALDAWVAARLPAARERFEKLPTVSRRDVYVSLPLVVDGALVTDPSARSFHATFRRAPTRLLVHGEGGAGKTSLACQLGRWGMRGGADGLCPHALLPVLIEQDLEPGESSFFRAVRGRLQDLIGETEPLSEPLTEQLLRNRRVLVIVDGLSERSASTRDLVQPTDPRFSAAALVVTSRRPEPLAGAIVTRVEPVRVRGDRLSSFMEAYLQQLGARSLFSDIEYFDACRRLSMIVGQRDTTVLLARLYAELLVVRKSQDSSSRTELPANVPDLMFAYLNRLNHDRGPDDPDDLSVHDAARIIAWESVHRTYQPGAARRAFVLQALPAGEALLRYLESNLAVVQRTGPAQDSVRLTLDPLAEYLAADHLVRGCGADPARWQTWLDDFARRSKEIGPENITGFTGALRDCLAAHAHDLGVPPDVPVQLEAITDGQISLRAAGSQA
jgi:HEAT repeat protein